MSSIYGYIRVSSKDQNEDRQLIALNEVGVERKNIYLDKRSGKDFDRPQYKKLLRKLKKDDLLYIKSIDRLGRNYEEILQQWRVLTKEKGIDIVVLDMPLLDTSTATENLDKRFIADLVLQILSYTAEKERTNIRKRQAQGIEVARAHGVKMGRPTKDYPENWQTVYIKWKQNQILAVDAMRELNLTKPTFYRLVKRYEGKD